ncbi:AlpA family transcriptional regulator [Methylocystis sp. WRRC1]|uniref:AlpA family phage regulatory protein n=1 Tax=Methylocystis sp. WRRC1 TaxID=1732014 RepID=UPI001D14DF4B|nr:AlpA family phage regulatory protein [Methylocystis sp. WRRC1]MCC3245444.1 AlpA family transcriptional regulator [Methylocystis sp. WRRC1]
MQPKFHRILRMAEVLAISGFKPTQLGVHIERGDFPAPVKLTETGRAIGWLEEEIDAWRAARIAARDAETPQQRAERLRQDADMRKAKVGRGRGR